MKVAIPQGYTQNAEETYLGFLRRCAIAVSDNYDFVANSMTDETNTQSLCLLRRDEQYDYIVLRDSLKLHILPNFATLSTEDQKILVSYYIYPPTFTQADIDALFTTDEQKANWELLADISKVARYKRWEACRQKVSFTLTQLESLQFYTDTKSFQGDYIDANLPNLTLWLSNGSYPALGIDYTTNGFAQKSYYTEERKNICLDVLVNGNY